MKLNRNLTHIISYVLDNLFPAVIRDSKWFMWIPFKLLFKSKTNVFFGFKEKIGQITEKQLQTIYQETADVHLSRATDLNRGCERKIINEIIGETVLEVGCGSGYLIGKLEDKYAVTGVDFNVEGMPRFNNPLTQLIECSATKLPFEDNSFDTVICTHTLEHVLNIYKAIKELKRVCKNKLIVVVPKQRAYRYTFDLHVHFFPYEAMFENLMRSFDKKPTKYHIETIQGDIYYHEHSQDQ